MRIIYATSAVWAASVVFFCGMIRNVDGQANILTSYTDPECREMTSSNITIFGVQDFASSTQSENAHSDALQVGRHASGRLPLCIRMYSYEGYGDCM